jgi:hypothetical protein
MMRLGAGAGAEIRDSHSHSISSITSQSHQENSDRRPFFFVGSSQQLCLRYCIVIVKWVLCMCEMLLAPPLRSFKIWREVGRPSKTLIYDYDLC